MSKKDKKLKKLLKQSSKLDRKIEKLKAAVAQDNKTVGQKAATQRQDETAKKAAKKAAKKSAKQTPPGSVAPNAAKKPATGVVITEDAPAL